MAEFRIDIKSSADDAVRAAQQELKALNQIDRKVKEIESGKARESKRSADTGIREARRRADQESREFRRVADSAAKEAQRQQQLVEKWAFKEYQHRMKVEDLKVKEYARGVAESERLARRQAAEAERQAKREQAAREREAKRATATADREAKQQAANAERWIAREYKERAHFEEFKAQAAERANERINESTMDTLKNFAVGAMTGAVAGVKMLADAWAEVEGNILASGKAYLDYEKTQRETAALKGMEQGRDVVPESLAFLRQSGLAAAEAAQFERKYESAVPIGFQKGNLTRDVADKLKIGAARMAARQGADAATRGDLAGILGQFGKVESAQAGLGQLEAIRIALTEGRGDDQPLTQSLLNVAGQFTGPGGMVGTLPEMAALIGVTSLSAGAGKADTRVEELMRFLRGNTPEQIQFMKEQFNIDERMGIEQRLDVIVPKLREINKTRDVQTWLTESGIPSEQSRAAMEVLPNYEVLKQRFARSRAAGQGASVEAANRTFMASAEGRAQSGENLKLAAEVARGMGRKDYVAFMNTLEAYDIAQGGRESMFNQAWENFTVPLFNFQPSGGHAGRMRDLAFNELRAQAKEMGIEQQLIRQDPYSDTLQSNIFWMQGIQARGGDPIVRLEKLMAEQNELLRGAITGNPNPGGANAAVPPPMPPPRQPAGWKDRP